MDIRTMYHIQQYNLRCDDDEVSPNSIIIYWVAIAFLERLP